MPNIYDMLVDGQTAAFTAHTGQILDLVTMREDMDEVIKGLLDERRSVYNEFAKRIEAAKVSN